jgi:hypothetical protein
VASNFADPTGRAGSGQDEGSRELAPPYPLLAVAALGSRRDITRACADVWRFANRFGGLRAKRCADVAVSAMS